MARASIYHNGRSFPRLFAWYNSRIGIFPPIPSVKREEKQEEEEEGEEEEEEEEEKKLFFFSFFFFPLPFFFRR